MIYSFELGGERFIFEETIRNPLESWQRLKIKDQEKKAQVLEATKTLLLEEKRSGDLCLARVIAFKRKGCNYNEDTGEREGVIELKNSTRLCKTVLQPYYPDLKVDFKKFKNRAISSKSPITGKVLQVCKKNGDTVQEKDVVLTIEAMKMENMITAPKTGVLQGLKVKPGDSVLAQEILFTIF